MSNYLLILNNDYNYLYLTHKLEDIHNALFGMSNPKKKKKIKKKKWSIIFKLVSSLGT